MKTFFATGLIVSSLFLILGAAGLYNNWQSNIPQGLFWLFCIVGLIVPFIRGRKKEKV